MPRQLLLTRTCSTNIAAEVTDYPTASSIWIYLKEMYDQQGFDKTVSKWQDFVTFRVKPGADLSNVCQQYKRLVLDATETGHTISDITAISSFLYTTDEGGYSSFAYVQRSQIQEKKADDWPSLNSMMSKFIDETTVKKTSTRPQSQQRPWQDRRPAIWPAVWTPKAQG